MAIYMRKTSVCILLLASLFVAKSQCEIIAEGCSSRCHPVFDSTLECFNKTLNFFETSLFGVMRNYVRAEINVATSRKNKVPYTSDELITQTLNVMNTVQPMNIEDQAGVLTVDEAKPIVEALIQNVQASLPPKDFLNVECPIPCEKSVSPYNYIIYASMGLNALIVVIGLVLAFISERNKNANIKLKTDIIVTKEELKMYKKLKKENQAMQ